MKQIHPALAANHQSPEASPTTEMPTVTWKDHVAVPVGLIPSLRTTIAIQNKTERNLLFKTWGGIGDQICSEPTLRYALKAFPDCNVSAYSMLMPYLNHLKFHKTYTPEGDQPNWDKFFVFETIQPPTHLLWQFFSHCLVNCVDFPSMCALRLQLPVEDRDIQIQPDLSNDDLKALSEIVGVSTQRLIVHPGKHWQSKTFPKKWWDSVLCGLVDQGFEPVIIGANADDNRGTVDVDTTGCIDTRNKLSLGQSIHLCQFADVILTNDSSPLHMGASRNPKLPQSGKAWIGYIATCKHPDYITHFRRNECGVNEWNWREENLGKDGLWNHLSNCPNQAEEVSVENFPQLEQALPAPEEVVSWTLSKMNLMHATR